MGQHKRFNGGTCPRQLRADRRDKGRQGRDRGGRGDRKGKNRRRKRRERNRMAGEEDEDSESESSSEEEKQGESPLSLSDDAFTKVKRIAAARKEVLDKADAAEEHAMNRCDSLFMCLDSTLSERVRVVCTCACVGPERWQSVC